MNVLTSTLPVQDTLTREQMLLRQQIAPSPTYNIMSKPKRRLSEELDEDLLFRFGYVPFVIAEVAWDYIDTLIDLVIYNGFKETKRLVRRMRELRKEYCQLRREVYFGAQQHEEDNMILFQEELSKDFSAIYKDGMKALSDKYPDLTEDSKMLVSCVYSARIVFDALFRYVREISKQVADFVGHEIGDILPRQLREMNTLVIEFAGDSPLGDEFKAVQNHHAENLLGYIRKIQLNKEK